MVQISINMLLKNRLVSFHQGSFLKRMHLLITNKRQFGSEKPPIILGIETSCDDTGCGILDSSGNILGESIHSQQKIHSKHGGIIPAFAGTLHRCNVTDVCEEALRSANLRLRDITAIATTVKPGLPKSLEIGLRFGKYLSLLGHKPFIPIHHMEAHALTVRMTEKVDFPYLALLISGGNCLLAFVQDVNKFYLLGTAVDNTPGEVLDKIARRLNLLNYPEFQGMSGGEAIELAARKATNLDEFALPYILTKEKDCQFSFSGLFSKVFLIAQKEEKKWDISQYGLLPSAYNICASVQMCVLQHLCQRTQRAMTFIEGMDLIPQDKKTLVISGGVASNDFIAKGLEIICSKFDYKFVRTPPKYCTDNGVMIAWNGMEKWLANVDVITDEEEIKLVEMDHKASLGESWIEKVKEAKIKCKPVNIKDELFSNVL